MEDCRPSGPFVVEDKEELLDVFSESPRELLFALLPPPPPIHGLMWFSETCSGRDRGRD